MNMNFIRKVPTPKEIKEMYPLSENLANQSIFISTLTTKKIYNDTTLLTSETNQIAKSLKLLTFWT